MISNEKVLVTGGSGFLGKRLQRVQPKWRYLSSRDCDLTRPDEVLSYFIKHRFDAIVHLAAMVGGIKDNAENQASYYYYNTMINTNVLHAAHVTGVQRVLSSLSTCAFPVIGSHPDRQQQGWPFSERDMFYGPPEKTNFSYGMSKRMLQVASISYRKQYNRNYSTFCPSNIYGPEDHFGKEKSHFIAALVEKVANNDIIELWGTGRPLRQQLYVDDLCEIIPILLEKHNSELPLIVAPNENLSISEMADILIEYVGTWKSVGEVSYTGMLEGQYRKDGDNKELLNLIGGFDFTPFEEGIKRTYKWYLENK